MPHVEISYETKFTAEHQPPGVPAHANEFRLVVTVGGELSEFDGIVIRFEDLAAAVENLVRVIAAVPPTEALPKGSSTERLAVWIWEQLVSGLPTLAAVTLYDGPFAATYRGPA